MAFRQLADFGVDQMDIRALAQSISASDDDHGTDDAASDAPSDEQVGSSESSVVDDDADFP